MSDIDIERLSPDRLPVKDAGGGLEDSLVERTSGSFLTFEDNYGNSPQIRAVRLHGLDPSETNNGVLYCDILHDEEVITISIRRIDYDNQYRSNEDLLAYADVSALEFSTLEEVVLTPSEYHPGISGTVTLASAEEDRFIQLFVPLSTVFPIIAEDPEYTISHTELRGVTAANSANGVLDWELEETSTGISVFHLTNPQDSMTVAMSGNILTAGAYCPLTAELEEFGSGSGISGTVVLENLADSQGKLVIKVPDGIRLPHLAGEGTRSLSVDPFGRIIVTP